MREAHPLERAVGMAWYASDADGTGGHLRDDPEGFRVEELEAFDTEPADADPDDYPHLVVRATLRRWDTNDFARHLSNALGVSRERVAWAGTKDKDAVTTQLFSVRGVAPEDLPDVPDGDVSVVGRAGRSLQFGDLAGNRFRIRVADPDDPDAATDVTGDLEAFAGALGGDGTVGVPNYFGQQRFGSRRPVTHEVGRRIVDRDWEGALMAYVGDPGEHEPEETSAARQYVEDTRDWAGAAERFPDGLRFERTLCHAMAERDGESPADFRAALDHLPRNLQRLFVHAYQSYVFNRIVSERLARGLPFDRPVAGDVVCFSEPRGPLRVPDAGRVQRVTADRVDTVARHCERGRAFVTAPLVGPSVDLGGGEPGEVERAVLDDLSLDPADFDLPDPYDADGTRRAVLVTTDPTVERDPLTLSFSLPKGSYATVLLREYLKASPLDY